jgi:hypothetical protein
MNIRDLELLAKKVLVGILITAVPTIILLGALWATQRLLANRAVTHSSSAIQQARKGRP